MRINEDPEFITIYTIKYWHSRGIEVIRRAQRNSVDDNYVFVRGQWITQGYYLGRDVFLTLEEAQVEAARKKRAKIAALTRQIAKLEGYVPPVVEKE
jgi:hypothetical protein